MQWVQKHTFIDKNNEKVPQYIIVPLNWRQKTCTNIKLNETYSRFLPPPAGKGSRQAFLLLVV
jgi:hypothetical protein